MGTLQKDNKSNQKRRISRSTGALSSFVDPVPRNDSMKKKAKQAGRTSTVTRDSFGSMQSLDRDDDDASE